MLPSVNSGVAMGKHKGSKKRARAEDAAASAPHSGEPDVPGDEGAAPEPVAPRPVLDAKAPNSWRSVTPPLLPSTLAIIDGLGFCTMTPVQAATIPLFLQNKDVCVEVRVGSGWCACSCLAPVRP